MPGEELVLDLRPHWIVLAIAGIVAAAEAAVAIWLLTLVSGSWNWLVLAALAIVLVAYPVRRLVWWMTSHFVVTTDRVIHREGWVARRSMDIPFEAINDVRFTQTVLDRVIGAGTLVIQSASEAGRQQFKAIRKPEDVQKVIYVERQKNQQRTLHPSSPATTPPPVGAGAERSVVADLERLADLLSKGVLTQQEFDEQKSRILGQA